MRQQSREHIVILFVGGVIALNYPLLDLFDRAWAPFGIPLLYCYLYLAWLVIIVLLIVVVEHSEIREPGEPPKPLVPPPENTPSPNAAPPRDSGDAGVKEPP
ncbi:MAG: hypothetical protein P9E24_06380 [Candidatus Competibacter sp.]|nr:hypothetical protein [Candidatus Competibacter sp.]MDG4585029.1 hypothetical protein [Candidatus Competibacter sp.]